MYVMFWRFNKMTPWNASPKVFTSEQDVRSEINSIARYATGNREYRWTSVGDVATWHDPFAEQAAREAGEPERVVHKGRKDIF